MSRQREDGWGILSLPIDIACLDGVLDVDGVIRPEKKLCRYADFRLVATSALQPLLLVCESSKLLGSPQFFAGQEGILAVAC